MTNNDVLKKIAIALNLKHDEIREIFALADQELSVSQVGGFMVNEKNKNYKPLSDKLLSCFLNGLISYSRGTKEAPQLPPMAIEHMIMALAEANNAEALFRLEAVVIEAKGMLTF